MSLKVDVSVDSVGFFLVGKHTWLRMRWYNRAGLSLHLNVIYCDGDGAIACPRPSEDNLDCWKIESEQTNE